jgi:tRNA A-37 threonylcarbamoyl transferase component Bud32
MSETVRVCPKCGAAVPAEAPQGLCPKCVLGGAAEATGTAAGSAAATPPPLEKVAAAFPQLEILELIGAGGMGAVFKARQPKLDRWVALKVLPEALAADPAFAERFGREARVLARLSHPNIVTVHDFGQAGGFFYLMMEYVDGVNLREAMVAGRFTPSQALALVPKICEALQYAHDEGILHRDIKPENILLDVKGRIKIADFGIAKLIGNQPRDITLTARGSALGTPHYMAPEQLEHPQEVDQRADIYSLGVVFYEMLTGELPIGRFAPPSEKSPVDPRVDPIVLRALERDREKRFASAAEVKTRVENLEPSPAGPAAPMLPGGINPPVKTSGKAVAGAVVTACSLVAGIVLLMLLGFFLIAIGDGRGGIGRLEVLLVMVLAVAALGTGLAGFLLGLSARGEIRQSGGTLGGKGLAAFAIWAWPALVAFSGLLVLLASPLFILRGTAVRMEPPAVVVHEAMPVMPPQPMPVPAPAPEAGEEERCTIQVDFDIPAGQAVTFVPVRTGDGSPAAIAALGARAAAPPNAAAHGSLIWRQKAAADGRTGARSWSTVIRLDNGSSATALGLPAPAELGALGHQEPTHVAVAPDSEINLVLRTPDGNDSGYAIAVRSTRREPAADALAQSGVVGTGTNWNTTFRR